MFCVPENLSIPLSQVGQQVVGAPVHDDGAVGELVGDNGSLVEGGRCGEDCNAMNEIVSVLSKFFTRLFRSGLTNVLRAAHGVSFLRSAKVNVLRTRGRVTHFLLLTGRVCFLALTVRV